MSLFQRICIIIHLSLVFTYLCWACLIPAVNSYMHQQMIESLETAVHNPKDKTWLEGSSLPATQPPTKSTWSQQLASSVNQLLYGLPAFGQAWAFFSLVSCLLLLYSVQGAKQAVWILPFIALVFGWYNYHTGLETPPAPDAALFPSEAELIEGYVDGPLKDNVSDQYAQLKQAWRVYLRKKWSHPPFDSSEYGEWRFNRARLQAYLNSPIPKAADSLRRKHALPTLFAFLAWNLFFAATTARSRAR